MGRLLLIIAMFTASACAAKEPAVRDPSPGHSEPMPAPRDGQVGVQEEFDAAAKANTVAAWDLFIARHADNALTERAKAERAALEGRR